MNRNDKIAVLGIVNDWVKFFDAKAIAILAFQSAALGMSLTQIDRKWDFISKHWILVVLAILGVLCITISIVTAGSAIYPRKNVGAPSSNIFFAHIAQLTTASQYSDRLKSPVLDFEKDMESQIWANSQVAWKKYVLTSLSLVYGGIGYALLLFVYIVIIF